MSPGIVTPQTLLDQLRDEVELVAASADDQIAWCERGRLPVDEIPQSLEQVAFTHRPRVREAGLLTTQADAEIDELLAYFEEMRAEEKSILWQVEGLNELEWQRARLLAQRALDALYE